MFYANSGEWTMYRDGASDDSACSEVPTQRYDEMPTFRSFERPVLAFDYTVPKVEYAMSEPEPDFDPNLAMTLRAEIRAAAMVTAGQSDAWNAISSTQVAATNTLARDDQAELPTETALVAPFDPRARSVWPRQAAEAPEHTVLLKSRASYPSYSDSTRGNASLSFSRSTAPTVIRRRVAPNTSGLVTGLAVVLAVFLVAFVLGTRSYVRSASAAPAAVTATLSSDNAASVVDAAPSVATPASPELKAPKPEAKRAPVAKARKR